MSSVVSAIKNTIPLLQFNRGMAGKIFSDVRAHGSKVVMKNNNAEVVLVPPDEYLEITDALNDYLLLTMATISTTHKAQGLISPTESLLVKKVLKSFRREYGTVHKKHDAATVEIIRYLLDSIPDNNSPKNIRGSYGALFTRILKGEHMTN